MSEEELVILQNIQYALDNVGNIDFGDFSFDDIQGLLDLYNKEKEKNQECFAENQSLKYAIGNMLHKDIVKTNYVIKDEIREEIEKIDFCIELQKMINDGLNDNNPEKYHFAKRILQELLEEEKMELEEAKRQCELYVQAGARISLVDTDGNGHICFRECDTSAIERLLDYIKEESISKVVVEEKIEELDKEEKELQNRISDEEREEYSDASISFGLMDIEIRKRVLQEILNKGE